MELLLLDSSVLFLNDAADTASVTRTEYSAVAERLGYLRSDNGNGILVLFVLLKSGCNGFCVNKRRITVENDDILGIFASEPVYGGHNGVTRAFALFLKNCVVSSAEVILDDLSVIALYDADIGYSRLLAGANDPFEHRFAKDFTHRLRQFGFHSFSLSARKDNGAFFYHKAALPE